MLVGVLAHGVWLACVLLALDYQVPPELWLLIERMDATRAASLFYLGPPVTMVMAWVAFGDQIQMMDVIGITFVFAGVLLTQLNIK